jgi:hypothetical protein
VTLISSATFSGVGSSVTSGQQSDADDIDFEPYSESIYTSQNIGFSTLLQLGNGFLDGIIETADSISDMLFGESDRSDQVEYKKFETSMPVDYSGTPRFTFNDSESVILRAAVRNPTNQERRVRVRFQVSPINGNTDEISSIRTIASGESRTITIGYSPERIGSYGTYIFIDVKTDDEWKQIKSKEHKDAVAFQNFFVRRNLLTIRDDNWAFDESTGVGGLDQKGLDGSGVKIAVLSDGVDMSNPIVNPVYRKGTSRQRGKMNIVSAYEPEFFSSDINDDPSLSGDSGGNYHGWQVTSSIWQFAPNADYYIADVEQKSPYLVNPQGCFGKVGPSLDYILGQNPDIIVLSKGRNTSKRNCGLASRFSDAVDDDTTVIVAAGNNDSHSKPAVPSTGQEVLSIFSYKEDLSICQRGSPESSVNNKPDLAAPGCGIETFGSSTTVSGSSFAAPSTAGVVAQLTQYAEANGKNAEDVRDALRQTAVNIESRGGSSDNIDDDLDGDGRIMPVRAYQLLSNGSVSPVAVAGHSPSSPTIDETVTFDAADSTDPDGSIESYEWDVDGDGDYDEVGTTVEHSFGEAGEREVTLRVVDNDGEEDTERIVIEVQSAGSGSPNNDGDPRPGSSSPNESKKAGSENNSSSGDGNSSPEAAIDYSPSEPAVEELVSFDATDTIDPDGSITEYEWDFDADGDFEANGATARQGFSESGQHEVTLRVTDDSGLQDTQQVIVSVQQTESDTFETREIQCENRDVTILFNTLDRNEESNTTFVGYDVLNDESYPVSIETLVEYGPQQATERSELAAGQSQTDSIVIDGLHSGDEVDFSVAGCERVGTSAPADSDNGTDTTRSNSCTEDSIQLRLVSVDSVSGENQTAVTYEVTNTNSFPADAEVSIDTGSSERDVYDAFAPNSLREITQRIDGQWEREDVELRVELCTPAPIDSSTNNTDPNADDSSTGRVDDDLPEDENEPNDDLDNATETEIGVLNQGTITEGDQDFFVVEVDTNQVITVEANGTADAEVSTYFPDIGMYENPEAGEDAEIGSWPLPAEPGEALYNATTDPGSAYISVQPRDGAEDVSGTYELTILSDTSDENETEATTTETETTTTTTESLTTSPPATPSSTTTSTPPSATVITETETETTVQQEATTPSSTTDETADPPTSINESATGEETDGAEEETSDEYHDPNFRVPVSNDVEPPLAKSRTLCSVS